jgi:hypothetical protein
MFSKVRWTIIRRNITDHETYIEFHEMFSEARWTKSIYVNIQHHDFPCNQFLSTPTGLFLNMYTWRGFNGRLIHEDNRQIATTLIQKTTTTESRQAAQ